MDVKVSDQPHSENSIIPDDMRALVLYASLTGNTRKVARAIARELGAQALDVHKASAQDFAQPELLFVGDGVYFGRPSRAMVRFLRGLPKLNGVKAAVFGTYGTQAKQLDALAKILMEKGAEVVDRFSCPGQDWFTLGLLHRHRPNEEDLKRARAFARKLAEGT